MTYFRRILQLLKMTPAHPQWLILRNEKKRFTKVAEYVDGKVLDIGCSEQTLKSYLNDRCEYIGLDFPSTAYHLYETKPMIYGDVQQLLFRSDCFDSVVLLEVLEHVPDFNAAIRECFRVLKPNGRLLFSMPFLYPLHDAPYDFQRFTKHGLRRLFRNEGFSIINESIEGSPISTAVLFLNIAMAKTVLNWLKQRNPLVLTVVFLPIIVPMLNLIGWLFDSFGPEDDFMSHGSFYCLVKK